MPHADPLVTNDAVVLGLLALIIGFVFYTERSAHVFWRSFYRYVPALLLCYFLPSLLNTFDVVDAERSRLYYVASRYLLPACLVLLTLSIDLTAIARLGYKAVALFLTGTVSIMLGGPVAILIVSAINPEIPAANVALHNPAPLIALPVDLDRADDLSHPRKDGIYPCRGDPRRPEAGTSEYSET